MKKVAIYCPECQKQFFLQFNALRPPQKPIGFTCTGCSNKLVLKPISAVAGI